MAYIIMATKAQTMDNMTWKISFGGCRTKRYRMVGGGLSPDQSHEKEQEFIKAFPGFTVNKNSEELTLFHRNEPANGLDISTPPIAKIQQILEHCRGNLGETAAVSTCHVYAQDLGQTIFTWTIV